MDAEAQPFALLFHEFEPHLVQVEFLLVCNTVFVEEGLHSLLLVNEFENVDLDARLRVYKVEHEVFSLVYIVTISETSRLWVSNVF